MIGATSALGTKRQGNIVVQASGSARVSVSAQMLTE
jgi:hypothetical protein